MQNRLQKLLLLVLALALATVPLRSTWSMTELPELPAESHCAQLEMQTADTGNSATQNCASGCNGSCCDANCNSCVPATTVISGSLILPAAVIHVPHNHPTRIEFTGRTVIPPLRPPATL